MALAQPIRSPFSVTFAVWKALFLREALSRISRDRVGWVWLVLEPVAHVALLMWLLASGLRGRTIVGADTGVFIMLGVLGFFMMRNVMTRCMDAIGASESLFAFRQIKPVDTVVTRAVSEGLLKCMVIIIVITGAAMLGYPVKPHDPLTALLAFFSMWLLGLGFGLVFSVVGSLVPEFGRVVRMTIMPLYFFSAVMFPSSVLPVSIRDVLLVNPILHGLEALRVAFMPTYQVPPGISLVYVYACAMVLAFLGLALHVRYRVRLVTT
jgi:capsular polysaccharide transport system permease protein